MSNIPAFGKSNITVFMALALTIGLVLAIGPAGMVAPGNTVADLLDIDRAGACKDTEWEVDVKLHSIDMVGKENVPYSQGYANCGGAQEIDFDIDLTTQTDACVESLPWEDDKCLSDNTYWNMDKSGYSNLAISFSNLRKAYANCDESRGDAPLESRTVERNGIKYEYDYHVFCFDVRVKTDADMTRYTTWKFDDLSGQHIGQCEVFDPETGKRTRLDSETMHFIVHETSFRLADLCLDRAPDITWEDQKLFGGDKYKHAVAANSAPPCILLGQWNTPFPECEGKRFDGSLFVQFDLDEWNLDPNYKGEEGYHIGIMGAYLNGVEFGKEAEWQVADDDHEFISDFEAETDFEGAVGQGGTRLTMLQMNKAGSPAGCIVFQTCDADFDGRGVASSQNILIELPVELMPAMYYEIHCDTGWLTIDKCRVQNYDTVNGFVDFTVRVDVISTGGFDIQAPGQEGPVEPPTKGEIRWWEPDYWTTTGVDWVKDNAVLALAIWFVFVISLVLVKFIFKRSPAGVVVAR